MFIEKNYKNLYILSIGFTTPSSFETPFRVSSRFIRRTTASMKRNARLKQRLI